MRGGGFEVGQREEWRRVLSWRERLELGGMARRRKEIGDEKRANQRRKKK